MTPCSEDLPRWVWDQRYRWRTGNDAHDADMDATRTRVARAVADAEPARRSEWETRFRALLDDWEFLPGAHPITGPLLRGGPIELLKDYGLAHRAAYADACHLCYEARCNLRDRFPEVLTPDQVYGIGLP